MFNFNTQKPYLILDLDGTLFHLKGDWSRVHEMIRPYTNVIEACKKAVMNNDKKFFEELHKLELIQEPVPLKLASIIQNMNIDKYIVTNNTTDTGELINQKYNLGVKKVIGIDQVSAGKPSSEGLQKIIDEFKLKPENGYYIGNEKTDQIATEKAGLSFIYSKIFNY